MCKNILKILFFVFIFLNCLLSCETKPSDIPNTPHPEYLYQTTFTPLMQDHELLQLHDQPLEYTTATDWSYDTRYETIFCNGKMIVPYHLGKPKSEDQSYCGWRYHYAYHMETGKETIYRLPLMVCNEEAYAPGADGHYAAYITKCGISVREDGSIVTEKDEDFLDKHKEANIDYIVVYDEYRDDYLYLVNCSSFQEYTLSSISSMILTDTDELCLINHQLLYITDNTGKPQYTIDIPSAPNILPYLQKSTDGTVYLIYYKANTNYKNVYYCTVDYENGVLGEEHFYPLPQSDTLYFAPDHTFYVSNSTGLYSYDEGDAAPLLLFDWASQCLVRSEIDAIDIRSDSEIHVATKDPLHFSPELAVIRKIPYTPETVRQSCVIACESNNNAAENAYITRLQTAVNVFNRYQNRYSVRIRYYTPEDNSVMSLQQRIASDIANGDQIDMILFSGNIKMEYFENLQLLGDWYPFLDSDDIYPRSAFLPCIMNAYETGAQTLPVLTTDYSLSLLVGKSEIIGTRSLWSYQDCADFIASLEDDQLLFYLHQTEDTPGLSVLQAMLPVVLDDYVSYDDGTSQFDCDSFRQLLSLCDTIPVNQEIIDFHADRYAERDYMERYQKNQLILYNSCEGRNCGAKSVTHIANVANIENKYFNQAALTWIGYPVAEQSEKAGIAVHPYMQFGFCKNSGNTDCAWAFLKSYFYCQIERSQMYNRSDERANRYGIGDLPCTYTALEAMYQHARTKAAYIDGSLSVPMEDDRIERDEIQKAFGLNLSPYYTISSTSEETLTHLLETTSRRYSGNTEVLHIVYEEASYYYNGIRSLDETVKYIQKRAALYMSEQHG